METSVKLSTLENWKEVRCDEAFLSMEDDYQVIEATAMVDGILNVLHVEHIRNIQIYLFLGTVAIARVDYHFGELKVFRTPTGEMPLYPISIRVEFTKKENLNED